MGKKQRGFFNSKICLFSDSVWHRENLLLDETYSIVQR